MKTAKKISFLLAAVLFLSTAVSASASGGYYFPDVKKEMSSPDYWSEGEEILLPKSETAELNAATVSTKETCMYDLKNQPEMLDGIALNEALIKSGKADSAYYLGWTYLASEEKATQADFDKMIENTQNPRAQRLQRARYGIAVKRTHLRTFPSDTPIWDDPTDFDFDYQYLVGIRVNEPVVITSTSKDGKYYLAKSICCSGWIPAEDVAICKDKQEWLSAWDIENEDALVVWGDKVHLESSNMAENTSELMLTMGTVLKKAKDIDPNVLIDNRAAYNNYAVWVPVRNEDGTYAEKLTLISESEKVNDGYLDMTEENIAKVALSVLGNVYGWGGSLNSDDCSGYVRNVYKCFGIELARNTTWQMAMPMGKVDLQYMSKEEKLKFLDALPLGSILFFKGHEMLYLGEENGQHYVISSVSSMMRPEDDTVRQRIRSTVINTLMVKRANGNTWFDELTAAVVPYYDAEENALPDYEWYHDGVAFCIKNKMMQGDENKFFNPSKNITWAEVLQILYNAEGIKEEAEKTDDEAEGEEIEGEEEPEPEPKWYAAAVKWATENKLVYEEDAALDPESAITREQIVSVLYLYAQFKGIDTAVGEDTNILSYEDAFDLSEYAIPAMQYAVGSGIITGKTEKTLNPKDNATRAEIAVMLERFYKNTEQ